MVNITHKQYTLRKAVALATVRVSAPATIEAVKGKKIPKGDVFEFARAAGLFAIKKTSDVVPDCHPLPVEYTGFSFEVAELEIRIRAEVHTVYKTGVEVEAMHGAMIAALTIYDMLKPVDKGVEIHAVRLESKTGGKSERQAATVNALKTAVVVCSDRAAQGVYEDASGKLLVELLNSNHIPVTEYTVIADDPEQIREKALALKQQDFDLVLFTGGTGVSRRDVTPDVIGPLLTMEMPGVMEAARNYGQQRTPFAMLSRGIAGFSEDTFFITMPGSPQAVRETTAALFPHVLHVFKVRQQGH